MAASWFQRLSGVAVGVVLALVLALLVSVAPAEAQPVEATSITIIKDDELPSNAELAVRLSEATPLPDVSRVVISRDDDFADALASGVLQDASPLMLVPRNGPVPDRVLAEISRVGAGSAVILGGDAAVSPQVEQQLAGAGISVQRRQGGSRFETAIAIAAAEAPDATTAILARAYGADPDSPTQGFADALAAGAMAADNGWPILLSDTGQLTTATRDYLAGSKITRVMIVGGTAAVSDGVADEVRALVGTIERIAGDSRAGTAVEIAKERGTNSAADAARIVLVDGTSPDGFAGGFAAAAHAAFFDAPILLADGLGLPPETQAFLAPGAAFAQAGNPVAITCVVHPLACDGGREALGLVDFPLLDVDPPINSLVNPGQLVSIRLSPAEEGRNAEVTLKGSCLSGQQTVTTDGSGVATFSLASSLGEYCSVEITYGTDTDLIQQGYSYTTVPDFGRGEGIAVTSDVFAYGTDVPSTPTYVNDEITCVGPAGEESRQDSAYLARYLQPDFHVQSFGLTSSPLEALPGDTCTATATVPEGLGQVLWGLYSWSDAGLRNPLLLGRGTTATFDFDQLGTEVTDVNIVWILQTNQTDISLTPQNGGGTPGQVFNPEGLAVVCDGSLLGDGLSFVTPGAACSVSSPGGGLDVLVVEPGRALQPANEAAFLAPTGQETIGVYSILTDGDTGTGCVDAPELPYATITAGLTTASAPTDAWTFVGFQGESLRLRADASGGSELDPILSLYQPDGSLLTSNDDGDSGFDSRIDVTLPVDGTYCVEVSGFGGSSGDYWITADPAPDFVINGEFTDTAPEALYDYTAVAGDLLILELRAEGFSPTDPLVEIYGPDGMFVTSDDDGGGYPNARLEFVAPTTGTYTIRATVFADSYGDFLLEASFPTSSGPAFAASG